jgi:Acetyltransferases, including N-acetylases of ribosomal proteins
MIETERLKLIACSRLHLETLLKGENFLAELMELELADGWLHFPESVPFALKMLEENPQNIRWGMHLFVHKADNRLVGTGGFKGVPDESGMVEIGCAIAPGYQNQGLATEAARAMIEYAFSWAAVKTVDAHTLAGENASTAVLTKCGMMKIGEKNDPDEGPVWHWRIERQI